MTNVIILITFTCTGDFLPCTSWQNTHKSSQKKREIFVKRAAIVTTRKTKQKISFCIINMYIFVRVSQAFLKLFNPPCVSPSPCCLTLCLVLTEEFLGHDISSCGGTGNRGLRDTLLHAGHWRLVRLFAWRKIYISPKLKLYNYWKW